MTPPLTLAEFATLLRVSVRTLEREAADGRLAITRVRSVRLITRDEADRYTAACRESPCPSEKSATDGKSAFAQAAASVLNQHFRRAQPETTRGRSKLRSSARRSMLQLVKNRDA